MAVLDFFKPLMFKAPEITYFDHLVGEFESLKMALSAEPPAADAAVLTSPPDPFLAGPSAATETARRVIAEIETKVNDLRTRRDNETIDWNNLYLLEMLLADVRPVGSLRSKLLSLRRDFRSVAGQVEYDEYLASKPKNLLDPPDPRDPPDKDANYEQLLRDDLKDVLGRLFKRYAILPVKEARLKRMTIYASMCCLIFLVILIGFILSLAPEESKGNGRRTGGNSNVTRAAAGGANANDNRAAAEPAQADAGGEVSSRWSRWPSIALFVVLLSGAMGGFVSALQRAQSAPAEGDSIYNLAMLYHGSYAVFVAPLTGAIFSMLLYFMFTGNILTGRFFPEIYTPGKTFSAQGTQPGAAQPDTRPPANDNSNAGNSNNRNNNARNTNNSNANNSNTNNSNANNVNANNSNTRSANANNSNNSNTNNANAGNTNANRGREAGGGTETDAATPTPTPSTSLGVGSFLYKSGPVGGEDYALLIIWSFIAGFAERFVPDSLNRLISSK